MALALPQFLSHAGSGPPTAKTPSKVPAALVSSKPGAPSEPGAAAKPKLQNFLDQLAQAVKASAETGTEKAKASKAKPQEAPVEKPKEPKKVEAKAPKNEAYEAAWASMVPVPVKIEATKAKPEAEALQGATEKAKMPIKDKKTGGELGVPTPVTAAAAEVARAQAQQNVPRSERSEEKQKVFVVDKRTEAKEKEKLKVPGAETSALQPVNGAPEVQTQATKTNDPKGPEVQVTFQAVSGKGKEGFDLKPQNTPVSPRDAMSFQQYLVERGYGQMVDQARIVLKDQNAGEIRMTLYPESLGKVKVALNLSDNSLAGQIFVENQTVKDVFQANMDGLMQSFQEGGWNTMSLEVSVGNGSGGQPGERQPFVATQAQSYGNQVAETAPVEARSTRIGSWNDRQINLTA